MIVRNYKIPDGRGRKALLINPPVYDFAFTTHYNQPDGLLRIGTLLKKKGYDTVLLDLMEPNGLGRIPRFQQKTEDRFKGYPRYHFGLSWGDFERKLRTLPFEPDEVYVTSIMTYWWESTRDAINVLRRVYPNSQILLGGIYPTLCPEHAEAHTGVDTVVKGEVAAASELWTDVGLYRRTPEYAIVNVSRGCPFNCAYCAQKLLNGPGVRFREPLDIVEEIAHKARLGIKTFWIFSDNFLVGDHFHKVLEEIVRREIKITISAPKGIESRLVTPELLNLMKAAGWKTINMAFESMNEVFRQDQWNRKHNTNREFERALRLASDYGFQRDGGGVVAFVLFGAPGENIQDVWGSAVYLHQQGVFIRPMPFTPVPGTPIYEDQRSYIEDKGYGLEDLNEKLYPFAEFNGVPLEQYGRLHREMYRLNAKLQRRVHTRLLGAADILNFRAKMPSTLWQAQACPA